MSTSLSLIMLKTEEESVAEGRTLTSIFPFSQTSTLFTYHIHIKPKLFKSEPQLNHNKPLLSICWFLKLDSPNQRDDNEEAKLL